MIKITQQSATNQYDDDGRAITTWDAKKGAWIVNPEFENEEINWWGYDNDFPAGQTLAEFEAANPNWAILPDIIVTWTWGVVGYVQAFKEKPTIEKTVYTGQRSWGNLDYTKEEAIERLGKYCDFNKYADNTQVEYNGETIFNGKL